ncbi:MULTISPECIES: VpaChn25_0724 family phage protein [unclassified Marinovum]|uniref:VpaChn25_0724 family phage protein n=1 Tax=unclassified Marinovum TaxID=2647166 RepID=UPI003EDB8F4F
MIDLGDMDRRIREDARLIILKALAGMQPDETLHSGYLQEAVATYGGIRRDREWVHDELNWLHERGAIATRRAGSVMIATLQEKGHRHLRREIVIEGVKRPSRPGS